jgi:CxxC motif-containing protein (DUF1111 family)
LKRLFLVYAGGDHTLDDLTADAFAHALNNLNDAQITAHDEGDEFFAMMFEPLGTVDSIGDGLGSIMNATSCEGCHVADGRGQPLTQGAGCSFAWQSTNKGYMAKPLLTPSMGDNCKISSIAGYQAEGSIAIEYTEVSGTFADGTPYSLRAPVTALKACQMGRWRTASPYSPRVRQPDLRFGLTGGDFRRYRSSPLQTPTTAMGTASLANLTTCGTSSTISLHWVTSDGKQINPTCSNKPPARSMATWA